MALSLMAPSSPCLQFNATIPHGLSPALRRVTLGPVLVLWSLAPEVMVMPTGATVIWHLVCAKP